MQDTRTDISGYPGYQISNYGRVKSTDRIISHKQSGRLIKRFKIGVILRPNDNGNGYLTVQLGRGNRVYIHRLVAEHFIDNPNGYPEINHINANKQDNTASNLEWCERQENINHSVALGLNVKGERCHTALLNEDKVRIIRGLISSGTKQVEIAKQYGISTKCVSDIKLGYTWKHVV